VRPHVAVTHCKIDSDKKASQLVKRLADFICEETQCRLDRIYLEHLHGPVKHENGIKEGPTTQDISLKSDLDSLYAEIRDVVAMSVYREFESPLLKSRQEDQHRQSASEDLSNRFVSYPNPCSVVRPDNRRYSARSPSLDCHLKRLSTASSHYTLIVHRLTPFSPSAKRLVLLLNMISYSPQLLKNHLSRKLRRELCSVLSAYRTRFSPMVDHWSLICLTR
jgi:hypothetical protein